MLITRELLNKATELTLVDIRAALSRNGYNDHSDLKGAEFRGMNNNGTFVYAIEYDEGEAELSTGNIYVKLQRQPMSKNFEFYAEY